MPKAKPSQIIVHRVELQETERAALEAALAGRFVTNAVSAAGSVLTGLGNALTPFAGVLTAIGAAYIAEKGISSVVDAAKTIKDTIPMFDPRNQSSAYEYLVNYLRANPEWDTLGSKLGQLAYDLRGQKASPLLLLKLQQWGKTVSSEYRKSGNWPNQEPALSFLSYYTPQEFMADQIGVLNPFD